MKKKPTKKLTKAEKITLRKASHEAVEESFSFLKRHFKHSRWIGLSNRYRENTIGKISADFQPTVARPSGSLNHLHLTQYIAASAPLHCADGWSLLGRAIDCHARRDTDSARHFAYYAELRAALSLLAAQGVGIFNTTHFVVEKLKRCGKLGGPTHQVTWLVLKHWAESKRSSDLFGASIRINGVTLKEWIESFPRNGSLRAIGSKWLRTWGLDLRVFSEDRDIRNEASYRPTKLTERPGLSVEDSADYICALWSLCEPYEHAPFNNLDRHLLRLALEETFLGVRGTTPTANPSQFKSDVETMLSRVVADPTAQPGWLNFFTRVTEPRDPIILSEARQTNSIDAPRQHLQMISRAALLLRVATAANSQLLQETNVSRDDLEFWWSAMGEERGLWMKTKRPTDLNDLWADAEASVKSIKSWRASTPAADRSFVQWRQQHSEDISVLGGCERIALWGLEL